MSFSVGDPSALSKGRRPESVHTQDPDPGPRTLAIQIIDATEAGDDPAAIARLRRELFKRWGWNLGFHGRRPERGRS